MSSLSTNQSTSSTSNSTSSTKKKSGSSKSAQQKQRAAAALRQQQRQHQQHCIIFTLLLFGICWIGAIIKSHSMINKHIHKHHKAKNSGHMGHMVHDPMLHIPDDKRGYIVFTTTTTNSNDEKTKKDINAGNIAHGLLAAHLLAHESGRIVCIDPNNLNGFLMSFRPTSTKIEELCETIVSITTHKKYPQNDQSSIIVNKKEDDCIIRDKLLDDDIPIIYFTGSTYPGNKWPHVPSSSSKDDGEKKKESNNDYDFFTSHYEPTNELQAVLPRGKKNYPPDVVLHLHDDLLLKEDLGLTSPYIIADNIRWYDYLASEFGWDECPPWSNIDHEMILGGSQQVYGGFNPQNVLHLWADWYTIAMTKKIVYHIGSEFSSSAVHWTSKPSKVINSESIDVEFMNEVWLRQGGGEVEFLTDRKLHGC